MTSFVLFINITGGVIKSRNLEWAGNVASMVAGDYDYDVGN